MAISSIEVVKEKELRVPDYPRLMKDKRDGQVFLCLNHNDFVNGITLTEIPGSSLRVGDTCKMHVESLEDYSEILQLMNGDKK